MIPKYNYEQKVSFNWDENKTINGYVYIIDRNGIFADNTSVYYDIMSDDDKCLYKHIKEDELRARE